MILSMREAYSRSQSMFPDLASINLEKNKKPVIIAGFVLFLVLANQPLQIIAGLPFILVTWFLYGRPLLRRQFLKAIADRPQWELHAERAPEGPVR